MGLFGGFKGQLKGSKEKKPKEGKNQVVCVKFKTFSEFDDAIPSCSNVNLGRNDVIKERRRPTKPEIKGFFDQRWNGEAKDAASNEEKAKPLEATNSVPKVTKSAAPKPPPPKTSTPAPVKKATVKKDEPPPPKTTTPAKTAKKKEAPPPKTKAPTKSPKKEEPPPAKTKAPGKTPKKEEPLFPKVKAPGKTPKKEEPLFPKVKAPGKTPKKEEPLFPKDKAPGKTPIKEEPKPVVAETVRFPLQISDSDDDEGNFKIHFAGNVNHHKFDDSSDDENVNWSAKEKDLSPINYSSQASSIFFGGDEEPQVVRPRNIAFKDDGGDSDGSSASA